MSNSPSSEAFVAAFQTQVRAGFTLLAVMTSEEARARELLAIACKPLPIVYWSPSSGTTITDALRTASDSQAREIHVLVDAQAYLQDPVALRLLREIGIGARRAIVVLLGSVIDVPPDLERELAVVDLPLPTRDELAKLIPDPSWDAEAFVRAAAGLSTTEATRAFRLGRAAGDQASALRVVIAQKRRELKRAATLELIDADVPLDEVGGLDVLKGWLSSRVKAYGEDARRFGLPEPRGMLVCGVQGCGKSMVSKAAAVVLGLPLVRLDFAAVFASPSPEQALREGLRAAHAIAPLVLWVDEIEKGLGAGGDARQVRVFGAFLTWLQERRAPVFVAATANEVESLPPELARRGRFDEVFFVDLPSPTERADILTLALKKRGRDPAKLQVAALTKTLEHFSGAEIEQIVSSALFRAFNHERDVADEDLRLAAREIIPLAQLYEEKVQALRAWGKNRARKASADRRMLDLFDS